jgi:cellulose synthase/poly-beta-1,6-N-acetylglucosamine synthase-like glycosyltransferase
VVIPSEKSPQYFYSLALFFPSKFPTFMLIYGITAIIIALSYAGIIHYYRYHWNRLPYFKPSSDYAPQVPVSVIIPARNEAGNIEKCLKSLQQQDYPTPLLEVILVDDHSTDHTSDKAQPYLSNHIKFFSLPEGQSGKKAALAYGISQASGALMLTTDADCVVPQQWVRMMAACYEKTGAKFIAGPVIFEREQNTFERFQSLDIMGMMLITGAGIQGRFMHSSNGANLAYPKKTYEELNGFEGIDHIASGDDILFMQKVAQRYPGELVFLKNPNAAVRTRAMPSIGAFVRQRIRWGTKSRQYPEWKITAILAVVFFYCWSIIFSGCWMLVVGGWMVGVFVLQLLIKSVADYFFLRQASRFFGKGALIRAFVPAQFLHIIYIAVAGFLANVVRRYRWKERSLK